MGIGVSNTYVNILKELRGLNLNIDEFLIVVADEINKKYNSRNKGQLSKDLYNLAKKISSKGIIVKFWKYFSSKRKYNIILGKYRELFINNSMFRQEVLKLAKNNRKQGLVNGSEGYVLEELASISYMADKGYVKIGPRKKEFIFDNLASKYPFSKNLDFEYF